MPELKLLLKSLLFLTNIMSALQNTREKMSTGLNLFLAFPNMPCNNNSLHNPAAISKKVSNRDQQIKIPNLAPK